MKNIITKTLISLLFFSAMNSLNAKSTYIINPKPQSNSLVDFTKQCIKTSFAGIALASLGYSSYQLCKFIKYWLFVSSENPLQEAEHEDTRNRSLYRMFAGLLVAMGSGAVATTDFTTMNVHFDVVHAVSLLKDALSKK
jgi:hypothetical protein